MVVVSINVLIHCVIVGNQVPVSVVLNATVMQKVKNCKDYLECLTFPNYKPGFYCVLLFKIAKDKLGFINQNTLIFDFHL